MKELTFKQRLTKTTNLRNDFLHLNWLRDQAVTEYETQDLDVKIAQVRDTFNSLRFWFQRKLK